VKLGLFGGGFKPFTTGHFAKLATAIRDNDSVYLFYGIQKPIPKTYYKRGPKKGQEKPDTRLRQIGHTGRSYTPEMSKEIFDIYERAIERELPNVEVESTIGSTPMRRIFEIIEEFLKNPQMYEKVTIYGAEETIREYLRKIAYFGDLIESGKVQLGSISPEATSDYLDEKKLLDLISRSEASSRKALGDYYPGASPEDIDRMQRIRGTEVRGIASAEAGIDEAKRFLPPFLNDSEKQKIINLLLGRPESQMTETYPISSKIIERAGRRFMSKPVISEAIEAHILNFYEDFNMPISEIFELIEAAAAGDLDDVQEKMDGQNITFTVVDGELLFFNKGGSGQGKDRSAILSHPSESVRSAFVKAYDAIEEVAVPADDPKRWNNLFQNGSVMIESALLTPENPNTIVYDEPSIRFIQAAPSNLEVDREFERFKSAAERAVNEEFYMGPVPYLQLKDSLDKTDKEVGKIRQHLSSLISEYGLSEANTVGDLVSEMVKKKIVSSGLVPDELIDQSVSRIMTGKGAIGNIFPRVAGRSAWQRFNSEILQNRTTYLAEAIIPLERIIQRIGELAFINLEFTLAASNREDLVQQVASIRGAFEGGHILASPKHLEGIRVALDRIGTGSGEEAVSSRFSKPTEGIVFRWKGKTRKLTGLFTPINKLRGFFAYSGAKIDSPAEMSQEMQESLERTWQRMILEGGNAFKDSLGASLTRQGRISRVEVDTILRSFDEDVLTPLGLEYSPVGSAGSDTSSVGDIDVAVNVASRNELLSLLQSHIDVDKVRKLPGLIAVMFQVPNSSPEEFIQIDVVPSANVSDTAWLMKGGAEGEVKGVYRNLLLSHIAKEKSKRESNTLGQIKYTMAYPGGLLKRINGQPEGPRDPDPDTFLPSLGINVPKDEANTFEKLVSYMKNDDSLSTMLLSFRDYIDNNNYLQSKNEKVREEAEMAINYVDRLTEEHSLRESIRKILDHQDLSEDIVYNSPAYGTIEVDDDATSNIPAVSDLGVLYQENLDAGNTRMAHLIALLNRELATTVEVNDPAAWERVGELMLSNLGFTQQTDIEGGPKVATFYDVLKDGTYYSVKTSFAKPARSPQTAFGSSALKLSQMVDYVMLPENATMSFGCIGCVKRRPSEIHWGITPAMRGGDFKIDFDNVNTPEQMKERGGVQFESPDVFVRFQEPYKGRGTRLGASAAVSLFGDFSPLWTIKLMEVPDIDPELEAMRTKLMKLIGASSEDMIQRILAVLDKEGISL